MTASKLSPVALALFLVAPRAHADEKAAIAHFEEGRALAREGDCAAAVPKLLASLAEAPSVGAALNLGDCYEKQGKTASAFARFREAERTASAKKDARVREASSRAGALEPRLSYLTIVVPPATRTRDLVVRLDEAVVPAAQWGARTSIDPGAHIVEVAASGHKTRAVATMVAPLSDDVVVTVAELDPDEPREAPVDDFAAKEIPAAPGKSPAWFGGVVALGAGAVGVGVGTFFGLRAMGLHASVKSACPDYPRCPADVAADMGARNGDATTAGTISTVSLLTGGALLAAGAALLVLAPASGPRVVARVAGSGAFVEGTW